MNDSVDLIKFQADTNFVSIVENNVIKESEESEETASIITYMDVVFDLNDSIAFSTYHVRGLAHQFTHAVNSRFELQKYSAFRKMPLLELEQYEQYWLKHLLIFMLPNKFDVNELVRLNILRKFVIGSYQGICHAQGKPIHGQRTWSNANTAYKQNKYAREFIAERRRLKQLFEDSLNQSKQSKAKRKKKRRKTSIRSKEDQRYVERPVKLEKKFKSGRRALRKKKKKFDAWC